MKSTALDFFFFLLLLFKFKIQYVLDFKFLIEMENNALNIIIIIYN